MTNQRSTTAWMLDGRVRLMSTAGCVASPMVEIQTASIAVSVESRGPMPERPRLPTEHLAPGADTFELLLRAAQAEIDRREGYETPLRAPHWPTEPDHFRNGNAAALGQ